jgi:serine/threonine-protein kinase
MALVYRAKDQMLERYVAIKILREAYSNDPDFQELFRQEARAAANLSHPNLVTVHAFGLDNDRYAVQIGMRWICTFRPDTAAAWLILPVGNFTKIVIDGFHKVSIHKSLQCVLLVSLIPVCQALRHSR